MRTQSMDTSPEIEQVQIIGLRAFAPAKKFASVRSISASMHFAALQLEVQKGSAYERALAFLARSSPASVVEAFRSAVPHPSAWNLALFDILPPLMYVSSTLDRAQVQYALTGALARALYGFPRGVSAIEVLVDLEEQQAPALVQTLRREQFVAASDWSGGKGKVQPLRLLYLAGLVSVNLCFPSEPLFDRAVFTRMQPLVLDEHVPGVSVLATEQVVLQGMAQYQASGACDDDLYNEILGVVKIQAPTLDQGALVVATAALGVQPLLAQLFEDAGLAGTGKSSDAKQET